MKASQHESNDIDTGLEYETYETTVRAVFHTLSVVPHQTIGPALSYLLVNYAQSAGMSKDEFVSMINTVWDVAPDHDITH
jgi:hypothetical protein